MSVFKSDGKTYDVRGRLVRQFNPSLTEELISQTGPLIAVTENRIYTIALDHVFNTSLDPIYTN